MVPAMSSYRECTESVEAEVAILEAAHRRALAAIPTGHGSLFVRRTARITAGVAGCFIALAAVIAMLRGTGGYARMLLAGWGVVPIAYGVAALAASRALRRALRQAIRRTGDPFRDHAALHAVDLPGLERELSDHDADASYAWPLVAITLLGPSTLQLLVGLALGASLSDLDEWLLITSVFSVHVYAYALVVAWRYPRTRKVWRVVKGATALSLLPGVLCGCISSFIVFLSAVTIVVIGYRPMAALMTREASPECLPAAPATRTLD